MMSKEKTEAKEKRAAEHAAWQEKCRARRKAHKDKMEEEHGLSGHPKADLLYEMAWDMGHADGYNEVETCYADMARLLEKTE